MSKPNKQQLLKYRTRLQQYLANLTGDVGSMRDEALRASEQDSSVDHLADQGTDNYDQGFLLGLIENDEGTISLIEEAIARIDGKGEYEFGLCPMCVEQAEEQARRESKEKEREKGKGKLKGKKPSPKAIKKPKPKEKPAKKIDPWIPKARLDEIPWARYCVTHQSESERSRESA
jgi:RNA polymerase-binding transcription factor DksA